MPAKSNNDKTQAKKTAQPPSMSESDDSDNATTKKVVKKTTSAPTTKVPVTKKQESSSEEESSSEDEKPVKMRVAPAKPAAKVAAKKKAESSSEEESSSSEEESSSSSSSSSSESEEETPKKKAPPTKKPVATKKKQESSSEEESSEEEEDEEEEQVTAKGKLAKAKAAAEKASKGGKKENLDDILGEFATGEKQLSKAQLKRLKKKQEGATATATTTTATTATTTDAAEGNDTVEGVTDKLAATTITEEGEGKGDDKKNLSKAQLARLRKKEKEAKEKEAKEKEPPKPVEAAKPAAAKPTSALAQRIKKEREEAERKKKEEEERIRKEEEAEAARIAEEKRLIEEEEKRKADKKARRAADIKAGVVMSNADKKKARAAAQAVEAMKQAGYVVGPVGEGEVKKKRPVYGKKPKSGAKKEGGEAGDDNHANGAASPNEAVHVQSGKSTPTPSGAAAAAVEDHAIEERRREEKQAKLDAISEEEPDWETLMASSDQGEAAAIPDSWDVDSEEEREKEATKKAEHDKRKAERVENVNKLKKEYTERKAARLARIEARKEKAKKEKQAAAEKANDPTQDNTGGASDDPTNKRKDMRSPICCILGHVDTGKTKLLDKIRHTNVQDMEAGGITQQIGATYFPTETIKLQTAELQQYIHKELEIKVPGLLVIDTPGHESFANLRSRGSGLCDIAILVVDIMAGLEQQTIESINLLKMRKTPFVVALNKCDRMYGWKAIPNCPFKKTLDTQTQDAQQEFDRRLRQTIVLFAEQGLNTCLYWENKDFKRNISIIPTSAITGEGVPDLLMLLVQLCQKMMNERLMYIADLQCTVLEVKVIEGHGTTIDVILANGVLHEGDTIVICGMQGPIVTKIRALLTPPPLKELRVKSDYVHNKTVKAAAGLKISAPNLEHAVPGSQLLVCGPRDDVERLKDEVMQDLATILARVDRSGIGVCVQASTLGSLEALLSFLSDSKIPVSGIAIGPVHKKDVMRAATMLERKREFAIILAFDVAVSAEAHQWAREMGVQIFTANIIYHLFEMCTAYMTDMRNRSIEAAATTIVFPCILEVLPDCVFRDRAPLVLGVRVKEGLLKMGTPLCVPSREHLMLGKITSIQKNHVEVKDAKQGDEVCIKIEASNHEQKIMFGRHFDFADNLYSKLSRASIDQLKLHFKDELTEDEWKLVKRLKPVFGIV